MIKKELSKIQSLIRGGFFHILTGNVLNKAIAMISSIIVARLIDKNEYAYLTYADNLYAYLTLIGGLGMSTALLKFCKHKAYGKNKAYIRFAISIGSSFDLMISLLLCIVVSVAPIPFPESRVYVWALALYPALVNLSSLFLCYIRTQFENKLYAVAGVLQSILLCILNVVFISLFSAYGMVLSRYIVVIVVICYVGQFTFPPLKSAPIERLSISEKREFFNMGMTLLVAALFSGMMPYNEVFLVNNIIRDEVTTANFKIAGLFPQMLSLASGAVTVYFFPYISQMTDWTAIRNRVLKIGLLNFFFIVGLTIIGMLCTPLAIKILYGEKYLDAIPMTYSLWIMRMMNCAIRIVPINMLPAIGKTKFNAWMAFVSCIVQIILDYYFLINMGISGVVVGATIVYLVSGAVYWMYFLSVCKNEIRSNEY